MTAQNTWQERGHCWDSDPALFFRPGPGGWPAEVFAICGGCPSAAECLEFALAEFTDGHDRGIWGGTTARQRQRIRAARSAA